MCEINERKSDCMNFSLVRKEVGTEEGPETFKICSSLAVPQKSIVDSTTEDLVGARYSNELFCYEIRLEKQFT